LQDNVRALASDIAKVPPSILHMKKISINRVWDTMGFRNIAPMGAETDALLHYSKEVKVVSQAIREQGLRGAIDSFNAGTMFEKKGS
jgi:enoyl-CoA hydratase